MSGAKPFAISKQEVWKAYLHVKSNGGSSRRRCGVDRGVRAGSEGESLSALESYGVGDVLSAAGARGRDFQAGWGQEEARDSDRIRPDCPDGGEAVLGAEGGAELSRRLLRVSAGEVCGRCGRSGGERCWQYDWVVELDIRAFFDTLDHDLVKRAVRKYTDCRWVLLYVERWLAAPIQREDGTLTARPAGTPQGGVVSPLLANIFLHLAFDTWMTQTFPQMPFERYADDILVHCRTRDEAERVRQAVQERLARCKLEVHPSKTKIVYCQDSNRRASYPETSFEFLSFTFRPRRARDRRGAYF